MKKKTIWKHRFKMVRTECRILVLIIDDYEYSINMTKEKAYVVSNIKCNRTEIYKTYPCTLLIITMYFQKLYQKVVLHSHFKNYVFINCYELKHY